MSYIHAILTTQYKCNIFNSTTQAQCVSPFGTILATVGSQSDPELDTSVLKPQVDAEILKQQLALQLSSITANAGNSINRCRTLACRCIASANDIEWYAGLTTGKLTTLDDKIIVNDVSNACLVILRFLLLDGNGAVEDNLAAMHQESFRFLHKQLSIEEVMLTVMYPLYEVMYEQKYRRMKLQSKFDDKFKYNQILNAYGQYMMDDNDFCYQEAKCNMTLNALADTWQSIVNVIDFPWDLGLGSLIANFYFLFDDCKSNE